MLGSRWFWKKSLFLSFAKKRFDIFEKDEYVFSSLLINDHFSVLINTFRLLCRPQKSYINERFSQNCLIFTPRAAYNVSFSEQYLSIQDFSASLILTYHFQLIILFIWWIKTQKKIILEEKWDWNLFNSLTSSLAPLVEFFLIIIINYKYSIQGLSSDIYFNVIELIWNFKYGFLAINDFENGPFSRCTFYSIKSKICKNLR